MMSSVNLPNGKYISSNILEITAFPKAEIIDNDNKKAFEMNMKAFNQMLFELHKISDMNSTVAEILWVSEKVENQTFKSKVILLPTSSTIIIIAASLTLNPFICIVVGGIGTAFGEQASYVCGLIGSSGFDISTKKGKEITTKWFERNSFLTVLLFAFVPLPVFDIIGIIAGAKRMSWWKYTLAAVLGKVLKFTLVIVSLFYLLPFLLDKLPFGWGKILSDNLNQLLTSIK